MANSAHTHAARRVRRHQSSGRKEGARRGGPSEDQVTVVHVDDQVTVHVVDVARLLGGVRTLGRSPKGPLAAHELIERGLPASAVISLLAKLTSMQRNPLLKALGMSERTVQRHKKEAPVKWLSPDQSGRTWKFAEILAKATEVFGSQERAEKWLEQPAIGLEQRRPIDLLTTPAGTEIVETFLGRLEHGVYT